MSEGRKEIKVGDYWLVMGGVCHVEAVSKNGSFQVVLITVNGDECLERIPESKWFYRKLSWKEFSEISSMLEEVAFIRKHKIRPRKNFEKQRYEQWLREMQTC